MSILVLLLVGFAPVVRATVFIGVPGACERLLRAMPAAALVDRIDWRPYRAHLRALGHGDLAADVLMGRVNADGPLVEAEIRRVRREPGWRIGQRFDRADTEALGKRALHHPAMIPVLAALRGFDVGLTVDARLRTAQRLSEPIATFLAEQMPFWLGRDVATAASFLRLTPPSLLGAAVVALRAHFGASAGVDDVIIETFRAFLRVEPEAAAAVALHAATAVPWSRLPADVIDALRGRWIDLDQYPPLRLDGVREVAVGTENTGQCDKMLRGFLRALGVAGPWRAERSPAVVRLRGHAVGLLKRAAGENRSMLALRNVIDREGRLRLVMGGVYELSPSLARLDAVDVIEVDELVVRARTFVLNATAWHPRMVERLAPVLLPDDRARALTQSLNDHSHALWMTTGAEYHDSFWRFILRSIEAARVRAEAP